MANINPRDFRPEYLEQLRELKQLIFSRMPPKTVAGRPINGHSLHGAEQARAVQEGGGRGSEAVGHRRHIEP